MSTQSASDPSGRSDLGYWALVAAGEPFRLLFPIGTLLGLIGILLWPLAVWGLIPTYPGPAHARIMIEGFVTSFIIGFLGTALPRLLGAPRMGLRETLVFAAALTGLTSLHVCGLSFWGDRLFLILLLFLLGGLVFRFLRREDNPPPAFVLVALGLLSGLLGAVSQFVPPGPSWVFSLGRLLLFQGFVLLPVLGVGAFLLPRFFDLPNRQILPDSLSFSPEWKRRASFAFFCGFLILTSFVLESVGVFRSAYTLRAAGILLYFSRELPIHQSRSIPGSLTLGLWLALASLPLGYGLMALFPVHALTFLHVVFITGFSLLIFVVASRVLFGHSGQTEKFQATLWPVLILSVILPLAMLTRVSADWIPALRFDHYAYAAIAWAIGVGLWALTILPAVRKPDAS